MAVYLSGTALNTLGELSPDERERIMGVLERISIRPERYLRKMKWDPAYRLRMDDLRIYLDISGEDVVVLVLKKT